jgi:hypothetical protein
MLAALGLATYACCSRSFAPQSISAMSTQAFKIKIALLSLDTPASTLSWVVVLDYLTGRTLLTIWLCNFWVLAPFGKPSVFFSILVSNRNCHPRDFIPVAFPCIIAPWGLAPCACSFRRFVPQTHFLSNGLPLRDFKRHSFALAGLEHPLASTVTG